MHLLLPEFRDLLLLLKKHDVNFMLIGGYAVIYYGYERYTNDLDIWLQPENENKNKLLSALEEFGIDDKSLRQVSNLDFKKVQFFFFGEKPRRIDFLTRISNIEYEQAAARVNHFLLNELKVPVIHYEHLILSKISNNRNKDKADVEELQHINKYKRQIDDSSIRQPYDSWISKLKYIFKKK